MKLSADLLYCRLAARFPGTSAALIRGERYGRPCSGPRPGCVFISEDAAAVPGNCCLILPGSALPQDVSCDAIAVPAPVSEITEYLLSLWELLEDWEEQLHRLILKRAQLHDFLQCSVPVFGCPIVMIGEDFTEKDSAGAEGIPAEFRVFEEDNPHAMEVLSTLRQDPEFRRFLEQREPKLIPARILPYSSMNRNLFRSGARKGMLSVIALSRELSGADAELLERLGRCVDYALERVEFEESGTDPMGMVIRELLANDSADLVEIGRRLSALGWKSDDEYACLAIRPNDGSREKGIENRISLFIRTQQPCCCAIPYEDGIVCYVNRSAPSYKEDGFDSFIKILIRDNYLRVGYSRSLKGHRMLQCQYVQAKTAMELGSERNPYRWIHHFDEVAFPYLLRQTVREFPAELVCHPGLLRLRAYDIDHSTRYVDTLRAWLDCSCNAVHAAEALYIHRSTFLYRMDKLRELLDSDLTDPEELLYLCVSLRILNG